MQETNTSGLGSYRVTTEEKGIFQQAQNYLSENWKPMLAGIVTWEVGWFALNSLFALAGFGMMGLFGWNMMGGINELNNNEINSDEFSVDNYYQEP